MNLLNFTDIERTKKNKLSLDQLPREVHWWTHTHTHTQLVYFILFKGFPLHFKFTVAYRHFYFTE